MAVEFRKSGTVKHKKVPKYDDKSIWKDKEEMRKAIANAIQTTGLKSHTQWKKAYAEMMEDQEPKKQKSTENTSLKILKSL